MKERCPFQPMLELLGRKHTLNVLRILAERNPRRFKDIEESTKINPKTLTQRLRDLEAGGVVVRKEFNEIPPRVEYGLTKKGEDLVAIFELLAKWSEKHL